LRLHRTRRPRGEIRRTVCALALVSLACAGVPMATSVPGPPTPAGLTGEPTAPPTPSPAPTYTATPPPSPAPTPAPNPRLDAEGVLILPQPLVAGDWLTVDVEPRLAGLEGDAVAEEGMTVSLALADGSVYTAQVAAAGLDGRPQARFHWVTRVPEPTGSATPADASALIGWPITLTLELPADVADADLTDNQLVVAAHFGARDTLSPPEPATRWLTRETGGLVLHYLSGSAAERDLEELVTDADAAYAFVTRRLSESEAPVDVYLLDRVIGQGGYASDEWVAVSYPDRKYSPVSLTSVLRHELTHRLDGAMGCDDAPALMREGLAVYMAGGHYHPGPIRERAAALVPTIAYLPIDELTDGFYTHQHEIAYLEAGALISYLIDVYGWPVVGDMCETATAASGADPERWAAALDVLDLTTDIETSWHAWLLSSGPDRAEAKQLGLETELMDLMRAYQAAYDPGAHYLEGVLFDPAEAEGLGVVADFVRRPRSAEAIAVELVLAMAQEAVEQRDGALLAILIGELRAALQEGVTASDLVSDAMTITARAQASGWEPYRLLIEGEGQFRVYVLNTRAWPQRSTLTARLRDGAWELAGTIWSD